MQGTSITHQSLFAAGESKCGDKVSIGRGVAFWRPLNARYGILQGCQNSALCDDVLQRSGPSLWQVERWWTFCGLYFSRGASIPTDALLKRVDHRNGNVGAGSSEYSHTEDVEQGDEGRPYTEYTPIEV